MLIKRIIGTSGSGKTTELLKEIDGNTLLISKNISEEEIIALSLNDKSIVIDSNLKVHYRDYIFHEYDYVDIDTVLVDCGVEPTLEQMGKMNRIGVSKICTTHQLGAWWL